MTVSKKARRKDIFFFIEIPLIARTSEERKLRILARLLAHNLVSRKMHCASLIEPVDPVDWYEQPLQDRYVADVGDFGKYGLLRFPLHVDRDSAVMPITVPL